MNSEKKKYSVFLYVFVGCICVFVVFIILHSILDYYGVAISNTFLLIISAWIVILVGIVFLNLEFVEKPQDNYWNKIFVYLPQIIVLLLLLGGFFSNNPYEYYIIIRITCFILFAYLAILANNFSKKIWTIMFVVLAIIYNPIFLIHLNRSIWQIINILTIVITIASIFSLKSKN